MGRDSGRRALFVLLLGLLTLCRAAPVGAQTCSSPLTIPAIGGVFTGTTSGASAITLSCASASSGAPEAVYQWTPAVSGMAVLQTTHSDYDTVLAIETQCGVGTSTLPGGCGDDGMPCCDDCSGGASAWDSRVMPTVSAGQTYFVIVDGYGSCSAVSCSDRNSGPYRLTVTPPGVTTTTVPICGPTTTTTTVTTTTVTTTTTTVVTTTTTSTTGAPTTTTTSGPTTTTTTTLAQIGTCGRPRSIPPEGTTLSGPINLNTSGGMSVQSCAATTGCFASTVSATASAPEMVFKWTPALSGVATMETCGPSGSTEYDTVLYLRTGDCNTGTQIACNDDACVCAFGTPCESLSRASRITPTVTAGVTYYLFVDGYTAGGFGFFTLRVIPPSATTTTTTATTTTGPPTTTSTTTSTTTTTLVTTTTSTTTTSSTTTTTLSGAACASPIVIPAGGGTFTNTTSGANTLTTPCDAATGPEKVYEWTPSLSGVASLQTCGGTTNFDTVLSLRLTPCATGATLANGCNNDTCVCGSMCVGNLASKITPMVTAGTTYFVSVDGHGGASGAFTLTVTPPIAPTTTTTTTVTTSTVTTTTGGSTTTTLPWRLTGLIPGVGRTLDVVLDASNHALVSSEEFGLSVVSVSTPSLPVVIGATNPPVSGGRLAQLGNLALVGRGSGAGYAVIDVTSPTAPKTIGMVATGTYGAFFVSSATRAYATQLISGVTPHPEFDVIDLSTPTNPQIVGRLAFTGSTSGLTCVSTTCYVAVGGQLQIVNAATPTNPIRTTGVTLADAGTIDVVLSGTTAYVADTSNVSVVNVATTPPTILTTIATTNALALAATTGNRLYVVDGFTKLYDVSTPSSPVFQGVVTSVPGGVLRVAAAGPIAYLVNPNMIFGGQTPQGGLYIVDFTTPSNPVIIANVRASYDDKAVAMTSTLAVVGGIPSYAIDRTSVTAPTRQGQITQSNGRSLVATALVGTEAFNLVTVPGNPSHGELDLWNLSMPSTPSADGTLPFTGGAGGIACAGTTCYVTSSGFKVVDVSNVASPSVTGTASLTNGGQGVAFDGSTHAYVADVNMVEVVDVTGPTVVTSIPTVGANRLATGTNRLYVLDGVSPLKIYDVTTPTAPVQLSSLPCPSPQTCTGVAASGTTVFLAAPALSHTSPPGDVGGIYVLNCANGAACSLVKHVSVPGKVTSVAALSGIAATADPVSVIDLIGAVP